MRPFQTFGLFYCSRIYINSLHFSQLASLMFGFDPVSDMRWFGNAVPLIGNGKKTVKQPVHVRDLCDLQEILIKPHVEQ